MIKRKQKTPNWKLCRCTILTFTVLAWFRGSYRGEDDKRENTCNQIFIGTKGDFSPWGHVALSIKSISVQLVAIIHPCKLSCSVVQSTSATPLLPCSCVEGTLPVALTHSSHATRHTQINTASQKRKIRTKSNLSWHTKREEKMNMEIFKSSKASVQ